MNIHIANSININNMGCFRKYILVWLIQVFYAVVGISEENGYSNGRQQHCMNYTNHTRLDKLLTSIATLDINISLDYLKNHSNQDPYLHFYLHMLNNKSSEPNVLLDVRWELQNEFSDLYYIIKTIGNKSDNINGSVPLLYQDKDILLKFVFGIYLNRLANKFIIFTTIKGRKGNKLPLLEVDLFGSVEQVATKLTKQVRISLDSNACATSDLRIQENESLG